MGRLIELPVKEVAKKRFGLQCKRCGVSMSFNIELRSENEHDIKHFTCTRCRHSFVSETIPIDVMEAVVTQKRFQYAGKTIVLKFLLVVASTLAILAFML
jgi:transcription elongation factor Elf1